MDKYAIFLDIDGTLFDGNKIPQDNIRAINEARAKGHHVFINSGRALSFIPKEFINCGIDGIVCGIGAHVIFEGKTLMSRNMDEDALKRVYDTFENLSLPCLYEGENFMFVQKNDVLYEADPNNLYECKTKINADFKELCERAKISKISIVPVPPKDVLEDLEKYLNVIVHHGHYSEATSQGCSKSSGMLFAAKYLNIPTQRCIAMGDSANDCDMLKCAGISVAMGNAADGVKEICDYVTDTCKNAGVAKAIDKLVLMKK